MRRGGAVVLLVVAVVGLVALALVAASDKRDLAFTIGVRAHDRRRPTLRARRDGLPDPDRGAGAVHARAAARRDAPAARAAARCDGQRPHAAERRSARRLPRRLPRRATEQSAVGGAGRRRAEDRGLRPQRGPARALLYGNTAAAALLSRAQPWASARLDTDLTLVFLHDERQLDALPAAGRVRAGQRVPPGLGRAVGLLAAQAPLLIGVPLLLARALADSSDAP